MWMWNQSSRNTKLHALNSTTKCRLVVVRLGILIFNALILEIFFETGSFVILEDCILYTVRIKIPKINK
jgi:hypothetical protein